MRVSRLFFPSILMPARSAGVAPLRVLFDLLDMVLRVNRSARARAGSLGNSRKEPSFVRATQIA